MKKILFIASIALNVLLTLFCMYQLSRPRIIMMSDNSFVTRLMLQKSMPINYGDIVFMGGKQVADCDWREFLNDNRARNRGIPGMRISQDMSRLDQLLENSPAQLFLLYGIDELSTGSSPAVIVEQYKQLIQSIRERSPMTEIIVQSVFPVNYTAREFKKSNMKNRIETLNRELKDYVLSNGIVFSDLYDEFLDEKGGLNPAYFMNDGFSLSAKGYEHWKERIEWFMQKPE